MGTDWQWCYENPQEAASLIDNLQKRLAELKAAATTCGKDGLNASFVFAMSNLEQDVFGENEI